MAFFNIEDLFRTVACMLFPIIFAKRSEPGASALGSRFQNSPSFKVNEGLF